MQFTVTSVNPLSGRIQTFDIEAGDAAGAEMQALEAGHVVTGVRAAGPTAEAVADRRRSNAIAWGVFKGLALFVIACAVLAVVVSVLSSAK